MKFCYTAKADVFPAETSDSREYGCVRRLKHCQTGHTVFRPYPRRQESLIILQMSEQSQHFLVSYFNPLSVGPAEPGPTAPQSGQVFQLFCKVADILLKAPDVMFLGAVRRLASAKGAST